MNLKSRLLILIVIITNSNFYCQSKTESINISDCTTIIENVNIFTGEDYLENIHFAFNKNKILAISKTKLSYKNAVIIDGTNKTIIPPMINAHVHIWSANDLKQSLVSGVFVNLDMHNTDGNANQLRLYNDSLNYSKFLSSNAGATPPGGHGTQFGIEVPTINDTVSSIQFVQNRVNSNADYIKVFKEKSMNMLSDEQSLSVIEEAHNNKLLAVGHSHKIEETKILIDQGIDGLMHIWFNKQADSLMIEKMKSSNIFVVPTLLVTQRVLENVKKQGWAKYVLSFDEVLDEVQIAHKKGIPILCGTDAPNLLINHSDSYYDEMLLLSKAGLSNIDVLKSATTNIYKVFSSVGFDEIKKGSSSNFILIEGNPVTSINDIKNEKVIYKNGFIINK